MGWFNDIDRAVLLSLNDLSGRSWTLDFLIAEAFMISTFKLLPLILMVVWLWASGQNAPRTRSGLLSGVGGAFLALVVARIIQVLGPERPRPIHAGIEGFSLPLVIEPDTLEGWSSFPSDHAALAFSLAVGVWLANRRFGVVALLWAALVVCFPRIYAGFHYPSDILAGAMIGVASVAGVHALMNGRYAALTPTDPRFRTALYVVGFIILYQMATLFDDVRDLGSSMKTIMIDLI